MIPEARAALDAYCQEVFTLVLQDLGGQRFTVDDEPLYRDALTQLNCSWQTRSVGPVDALAGWREQRPLRWVRGAQCQPMRWRTEPGDLLTAQAFAGATSLRKMEMPTGLYYSTYLTDPTTGLALRFCCHYGDVSSDTWILRMDALVR